MIETERLILRPFEKTDAKDLFEYLSGITIPCFYCMKVKTMEEAEKALEERLGDSFYLAIQLKDSGKVIGEIFAHPEGSDPTGSIKDTFSPCWMLNGDYQRKGYMTEAANAYLDFLFTECGARRIYAFTEDYNISCQKLLEKLGFRQEGLYKEFVSFYDDENGNPVYDNTYIYAVLKHEWKNHVE